MIKDPVLLQGIEITGKFLYLYNQPFPVTKTSYVRKKVEKFSNKIFLKPPVARSYRTSTSLGQDIDKSRSGPRLIPCLKEQYCQHCHATYASDSAVHEFGPTKRLVDANMDLGQQYVR